VAWEEGGKDGKSKEKVYKPSCHSGIKT